MQIIKFFILLLIFLSSTYIGVLVSKKYINRVKDLREIKTALNIFETKIKFTYEPIPQVFKDISNKLKPNISNMFLIASNKMKDSNAGDAWIYALDKSNTNLTKEDIETLKGLGNLLGKVNAEGQISEIELIDSFLDNQIESAEQDKLKYMKMYKTLGISIGLAMVIILI